MPIDLITKLAKYKTEQDAFPKYKHIPRKTDGDVDVSVTEYLTPKDERGYQIIFYKTENNIEYMKSVGYGVEAKSRTYDWREIINEE